MQPPLDTPRGQRTVVVLGGPSSASGQTVNTQQLTRGAAFILAEQKKQPMEERLSGFMNAKFAKAHQQEEARVTAEKAYAARLHPRCQASGGRNPARSLASTYENVVNEEPKFEAYGRFIERIRRERANAIIEEERAKDEERAAARRARNPPADFHVPSGESEEDDEDDEEETPRPGTSRTDGAMTERRAAGLASARSYSNFMHTADGALSERQAAGMPSARSYTYIVQPTEGALSERRAAGMTSARSTYVVQPTDGALSERRAAGMTSARGSTYVVQPTDGALSERRAGFFSSTHGVGRSDGVAGDPTDGAGNERRSAGRLSARASTYVVQAASGAMRSQLGAADSVQSKITPRVHTHEAGVGVDAIGRHWDDGSLNDVQRRYAWSDYWDPKWRPTVLDQKPKPTRASRKIASMGVWTLSTGEKARPPSQLTEFPHNTWRRPPRRPWCTRGW